MPLQLSSGFCLCRRVISRQNVGRTRLLTRAAPAPSADNMQIVNASVHARVLQQCPDPDPRLQSNCVKEGCYWMPTGSLQHIAVMKKRNVTSVPQHGIKPLVALLSV